MDLDISLGIELIKKAYEKQADSMLWDMWLSRYPWMDEQSFMSFEDFKNGILKQVEEPKQPIKTKEEIINQAEKIVRAFKREVKPNGTV